MDWTLLSIFVTVAVAHFLALLSPGPDFLLIVKSAIKNGPRKSIGVAGGIASANALYISLCLIGVGSLLASSVMIMIALKVAGGLFLMYLAVMALRAKKANYQEIVFSSSQINKSDTTFLHEFITGFMSGILNPKNLLFYLSLFTVVLTKDVNFGFKVALGVWMTVVVFLWDVSVIYVLSIDKVRRKFSKVAFYIDKFTGALLGMIGFTIVKSALTK